VVVEIEAEEIAEGLNDNDGAGICGLLGVTGNMVLVWFVTIPASALAGTLRMFLFRPIGSAR